MIRKLMASTAVLALMSAGAFTVAQAQTEPAEPVIVQEEATTAPATTELAASEQVLTPDQPTFATVYIGRSVYSSEDPESDNIGDINDLIVSEDGTITHAVVGVGGFLGIGEKDVAVPFDELQVVEKDGDIRLIYASTREQLEAAPAVDRAAFDPAARFAEEQAASTDTGAGSLAPAPEPAQDMAAAPAEEPAAPAEEETAAAPAEEPAVSEETAAVTPAEEPTAPAEEETAAAPVEEPAASEETAAVAPVEEPAAPAEEETAAAPAEEPAASEETAAVAPVEEPAAPAEQETAAAPAEEPAAPAEQDVAATAPADATTAPVEDLTAAPAEEEVAATTETAPAASGEVNFVTASADQIQASDLMGNSVFGAENESIGEISDLILEEEGKTRVALIDVGGFLGAGEKTVAIPFDQLQISKAEDGSEQITVAMSKGDLEQLPAIEIEAAAAEEPLPGEQPADQTAAAPAEPAVTTEEPAATEEPAMTAEAPATDELTTGSIAPAAPFAPATQDLAASKLIGAVVYGPDDANLGEVGDLVFAKTGDIDAVVIDVGGFLGIGEKPVALEFDALNVREDEGGALSVMINASQEQLDSAPTFEEPTQAAVQ